MAEQKKKKRRNPTGRFLHVLILIVAILVIFEGRMVINIFTRHGIKAQITQQLDELFADMKTETPETEQKAETKKTTVKNAASDTVAGLTLDSPTTSERQRRAKPPLRERQALPVMRKPVSTIRTNRWFRNSPLPSTILILQTPLS